MDALEKICSVCGSKSDKFKALALKEDGKLSLSSFCSKPCFDIISSETICYQCNAKSDPIHIVLAKLEIEGYNEIQFIYVPSCSDDCSIKIKSDVLDVVRSLFVK